MTPDAASKLHHPAFNARRVTLIALLLLLILSLARWGFFAVDLFEARPRAFRDFRIFCQYAAEESETGRLYRTDIHSFHLPGSQFFKFPPVVPAALKPFVGLPRKTIIRIFLVATSIILLAGFLTLVRETRAGPLRALLMSLVFLNWQPTWDSVAGLTVESFLGLMLVLTFVWLWRGHLWLAGVPLGIAAATKVYPVLFLAIFVYFRRWRVLLGAAISAIALLLAAGLVLDHRYTIEYFTQVLPTLGGTALQTDNVSALANLGRAGAYLQLGGEEFRKWVLQSYLEVDELVSVRPMVWLAYIALAIILVLTALRHVPFSRAKRTLRGEGNALCLTVCFVLLMIPSSWYGYQNLLLFPLLVLFGNLPGSWKQWHLWIWPALTVAIGATLFGGGRLYEEYPVLHSAVRSLLPILIWVGWIRYLGADRTDRVPAAALN
ncbi:MAG: DUF2029 domain-containing protein [Candidatus Eisenbacteria sp.]|nr:DUF2029 domain-containing protein [Candidatus Eisenbacteria bacterium]